MKTRHLPVFLIDPSKSDKICLDLAKVIDQYGAASGFSKVLLVIPSLQKQKRDGTMHIEAGGKHKLFTRSDGHFHGTHHNIGNHLHRSGLVGTLVMLKRGGNENVVMPIRPTGPVFGSAQTVNPQPAVDPKQAMHSIGEFMHAMNWDASGLPAIAPSRDPEYKADPSHYDLSPFQDIMGALDAVPFLPAPTQRRDKTSYAPI